MFVLFEKLTLLVPAQRRGEIFFSGLYNKDGNGGGADFGLTSDVYTKPNPYHTKNKMVEKKPEPIYYPAVNAVDNNMASSSSNYDAQSSTGYSYELPAANYGSSGPTGSDTTSYNSAENSHSSSDSTHSPSFGFPAHTYGASASTYGSPVPTQGAPVSNYGAPVYNYGASAPTHLAPVSNYGASAYNYGAPAQSYGTPHSAYGVPASYYPAPLMEMPMHAQKSSASHWLLTKIFKKFDLIVMSKILLKLIIFKKIVKFIGIICLLLFIPTLKKKFSDETDEERSQYSKLDAYGELKIKENHKKC